MTEPTVLFCRGNRGTDPSSGNARSLDARDFGNRIEESGTDRTRLCPFQSQSPYDRRIVHVNCRSLPVVHEKVIGTRLHQKSTVIRQICRVFTDIGRADQDRSRQRPSAVGSNGIAYRPQGVGRVGRFRQRGRCAGNADERAPGFRLDLGCLDHCRFSWRTQNQSSGSQVQHRVKSTLHGDEHCARFFRDHNVGITDLVLWPKEGEYCATCQSQCGEDYSDDEGARL